MSKPNGMTRVLIIEGQMKQYRAPFFALLNDLLQAEGIELTVAYSDPSASEARKKDNCELPQEYGLKVRATWLWPDRLLYQPLLRAAIASDLVIVEQANRYVLNHFLLPLSRVGLRRVAFWGHGENRLPNRLRVSEWYRQKTLNWASWWFAYTKGTAKYLEEHGVPAWKITAVQNSVDTSEIREQVKKVTAAERAILRARLGIPELAGVGIFCGMLDKVKGIPFLIDSCRIIKDRVSNFHLILVGGGPDQEVLSRMIDGMNWVHWVGPKFGAEKTELMVISDVFLLPGKVGLAILDGFAASLPMLTTNVDFHAPEVEYLEEGVNGLISEVGPQSYADTVCSVLCRRERLTELRAGAAASAEKYSIENMSANFRDGVRLCLGIEKG